MGGMAPKSNKSPLARVAVAAVERFDSWVNMLTGLSTFRDKRTASVIAEPVRLAFQELQDLYQGNDLAARIVDTQPDEMTREGFELHIPDDKDLAGEIAEDLDHRNVLEIFHRALCWKRAYGGAGIVLGLNDGLDPAMPVNLKTLKSIDWMRVHAADELMPWTYYRDTSKPKFGEVETYKLMPVSRAVALPAQMFATVHETRIIRFAGVVVSNRATNQSYNQGWGDSVLVRPHNVLRDYDSNWQHASVLLQDFSQGVWKMEGLTTLVAKNQSEVIQGRIMAAEQGRSTLRSMLIDAKDDFERKTTPMGGLPEMLERWDLRLAAAADMPASLLMGQSPAGLNATGDADIRFWYMKVGSQQHKVLRPALHRFLELYFACSAGPTGGAEPEAWKIHFPSLWQMTAEEKAQVRLTTAQADDLDIKNGVLTPEEVATSRYGGSEYSTQTNIDLDARAEMAAEDAAAEEAKQAALDKAAQAGALLPGQPAAPTQPVKPGQPVVPPPAAAPGS
jgi:phage-related protein (TIGR01555 family)